MLLKGYYDNNNIVIAYNYNSKYYIISLKNRALYVKKITHYLFLGYKQIIALIKSLSNVLLAAYT